MEAAAHVSVLQLGGVVGRVGSGLRLRYVRRTTRAPRRVVSDQEKPLRSVPFDPPWPESLAGFFCVGVDSFVNSG